MTTREGTAAIYTVGSLLHRNDRRRGEANAKALSKKTAVGLTGLRHGAVAAAATVLGGGAMADEPAHHR